jgi:hypothetical protein
MNPLRSSQLRHFPASRCWFQSLSVLLLSLPLAAQVSFLTALHFPTGNGPRSVVAADVNGDGKPDLVSCNIGDGTISVLLGNGDGTFQPPVAYSAGEVNAVAVGDFNGDGKPDIAVANGGGAGTPKQISILLGNGDGTFQPAVNYPANNYTVNLVAGDFNGDGKLDIAALATNFSGTNYSGEVDILLGNGDGTFQAPLVTSTGTYGNIVTAADFNHDGKLDLAVSNTNDANLVILLGNGDGTFTTGASYLAGGYQSVGERWYGFVAADVNLDGKPDLVLTLAGVQGFQVMLGNGDGTFSTPVSYGAAVQSYAPIVADFNGDGKPDVAVTDQTANLVYVFLGNGDGTFQKSINYAAGGALQGITVADFNRDGNADLATADFGGADTTILLGNGDGSFRAARSFGIGSTQSYTPSITLGDLNGDGKLDVATGATSLLLGNGDGTFQPFVSLPLNAVPNGGLLAADFNHDGKLDLAATTNNNCVSSCLVAVLLGNGNGTFQPEKDFSTGFLSPVSLAAGGSVPDLVVGGVNSTGKNAAVAIGDGAGDFTVASTYGGGQGSLQGLPVTGDFNGDGNWDFVAGFGTYLTLFLNNGDNTFQPSTLSSSFSDISGLTAADFNGDGFLDLAVVDSGSVTVMLGNGDGTFQSPVLYPVGNALEAVVSADMNQDGHPDLVVLLSCCSVAVLLGNGDGTFQPAIFFPLPPGASGVAGISGLAVGDVNGDGLPDIVAASAPYNGVASINSVTVLLNQTGVTLSRSSVTVSSASNPAAVGQTVALTATVAPAGGSGVPTGAVTFMNGSNTLGTATLSGGAATLSTTALAVGNDSITASYSGDRYFAVSTSSPLVQVINSTPFTAAPTGGSSATVNAGQAATFTVSFTPATTQSQTIALTCSGAPPMATCTISPNSIPLSGTTAASATVTVQTAGTGAAAVLTSPTYSRASFLSGPGWFGIGLGAVLLFVGCSGRRRRVAAIGMQLAGLVMLGLMLVGCGGGSSAPVGTQPGTYTVVVTAQSGGFSQNINLTLTVQ